MAQKGAFLLLPTASEVVILCYQTQFYYPLCAPLCKLGVDPCGTVLIFWFLVGFDGSESMRRKTDSYPLYVNRHTHMHPFGYSSTLTYVPAHTYIHIYIHVCTHIYK